PEVLADSADDVGEHVPSARGGISGCSVARRQLEEAVGASADEGEDEGGHAGRRAPVEPALGRGGEGGGHDAVGERGGHGADEGAILDAVAGAGDARSGG